MNRLIAITATDPAKIQEAKCAASHFGFDFIEDAIRDKTSKIAAFYHYFLVFTPHYIALENTQDQTGAPFYIDFLSKKMQHRIKKATLKNELLARAIGLRPKDLPVIVDTTAGLGRDSMILAALGFKITLLERSPPLYLLLQDALNRAKKEKEMLPLVNRLHLIQVDATLWLKELTLDTYPDVIYIDPMFPERKKSSSVKKEMLILRDLLGNDTDSADLFHLALSCAKKRVVVKRPRLTKNRIENTPHFAITGKSSRFDIYLV